MNRTTTPTRGSMIPSMVLFALLALAGEAIACMGCSAQSFCCLPGFALIGGHVGLVLPILGGFLERPFFTLAGAHTRGLGFSIQANLLSTLATSFLGLFVMAAAWGGGEVLAVLWLPAAIVGASLLEYGWLKKPWRRPRRRLNLGWLMLGNLISAIVIACLPILTEIAGMNGYRHYTRIHGSREMVALLTLGVCLVIYIAAFMSTRGVEAGEPMPEEVRGFEVVPIGERN